MPGESSPPRMVAEVLAWQVVLYWWNRHRAPAPPIHRTLHCYGRRRATRRQFVGKCSGYFCKRETHHYLFVASFNAQTTLPHVSSLGGTIPSVCRPDATGSIFLQNEAAPTTKEQSQLSIVTRHGNSAKNTEASKRLKRKRTERELDLITL